MTDKKKLLDDFRVCIAGILNVAVNEISDGAKITLAQVLQNDPGSLRLHVALEPFSIVAAVFAADRKVAPVEIFRIESSPSGEFH